MILFQKRYFDSKDEAKDQPQKKRGVNKKSNNERNRVDIPDTENKSSDDVQVYNIKVTPRMLKGQIIKVRKMLDSEFPIC